MKDTSWVGSTEPKGSLPSGYITVEDTITLPLVILLTCAVAPTQLTNLSRSARYAARKASSKLHGKIGVQAVSFNGSNVPVKQVRQYFGKAICRQPGPEWQADVCMHA